MATAQCQDSRELERERWIDAACGPLKRRIFPSTKILQKVIATRPRGSVEIQYFVDVASFIDIKWTRKKNASWKGELSSDSYGYTEDEWYEYMYHYQWIDENKSYSNLEYSIKKITIPFVGKRVRKDDLNDDELGWPEAILALVHRDRGGGGPCGLTLRLRRRWWTSGKMCPSACASSLLKSYITTWHAKSSFLSSVDLEGGNKSLDSVCSWMQMANITFYFYQLKSIDTKSDRW